MTPLTKLALLTALPVSLLAGAAAQPEPGHAYRPLSVQDQEAIRAAIPAHARIAPPRTRRILIFYRTEGFVPCLA